MKRELKWTLRPEKYIQYERKKKKNTGNNKWA